ncbi:PTS system, mannose-specific IIA component [Amphibacillus marinus]|uniref:PTS system, mannose-specific IIA component n=1 Tax=Amphibacillus marinus TaxID=872970 RepID=A0A1H8IYN6_9BACI|nr:hypothetical protein [Amphibacillus marinus]SEN73017.1 PTS system, mannose-specific IIA component [Amphibacillus marinus]
MKKIIIGTHGHLSKAFIETAKLIAGDDIEVNYLCMTKGKSVAEAEQEARSLLEADGQDCKVIVLTDVLGGSVANLFTALLQSYHFDLITGVNLPMVLTALLSVTNHSSGELIQEIITEARNGIQYVNDLIDEADKGDDLDDLINEG